MAGRMDVIVRVLEGPLATQGDLRLKGPLIELGTRPSPGGLTLPGRGIDGVHARISVRSDGYAEVVPVGRNPVRLAPHIHVTWRQLVPLPEPAALHPGAVVYLGNPGRGTPILIVSIEGMQWTGGRIGTTADDVASVGVTGASTPARPARHIRPAALGVGVLGCGLAATLVLTAGLVLWPLVLPPERDVLGPVVEGEEYYQAADPAESRWVEEPRNLKGLEGAWERFVVRPSAEAAERAGEDPADRLARESWDEAAFEHFAASAERHALANRFWRRLETVRGTYAQVLTEVRKAGLPEVFAAIPFTESRYRSDLQSVSCAKGWWQFMPEVAVRHGLRVERCEIERASGPFTWNPEPGAPARRRKAPYLDDSSGSWECILSRCAVDQRTDLEHSTRAALESLTEAWEDPAIRRSGAAVLNTLVAHNAGLDDSRFQQPRKTNVRPALEAWRRAHPDAPVHHFYGANLTCASDPSATGTCGGHLPAQAQRYGYSVVAHHWLAACYYGRNPTADTEAVFADYVDAAAAREESWCQMVRPPSASGL